MVRGPLWMVIGWWIAGRWWEAVGIRVAVSRVVGLTWGVAVHWIAMSWRVAVSWWMAMHLLEIEDW